MMKKIGNILLIIAIIANIYGALHFALVINEYIYASIYAEIAFLLILSRSKTGK